MNHKILVKGADVTVDCALWPLVTSGLDFRDCQILFLNSPIIDGVPAEFIALIQTIFHDCSFLRCSFKTAEFVAESETSALISRLQRRE